MINYFKAAERLLAQRGNLEQALENLGRRRELASTQAKGERDNIKPRPYGYIITPDPDSYGAYISVSSPTPRSASRATSSHSRRPRRTR